MNKVAFFGKVLFIGIIMTGCQNNSNDKTVTQASINQIESINKQNNNIEMGTTIKFKGDEIQTVGKLPEVGSKISNFHLTDGELNERTYDNFKGQNLVLNIFPSIDTPVCAQSVRTFNEKAASLENTKVLCISKDLPFAQAQFCGAEGIENVITLSDFRTNFGNDFGVQIANGPLKGLMSRAIIVVDSDGQIVYTEQVPDIAQEPDYETALSTLQ